MAEEVTGKDIVDAIEGLTEVTSEGFADMQAEFSAVRKEIGRLALTAGAIFDLQTIRFNRIDEALGILDKDYKGSGVTRADLDDVMRSALERG